MAGRTLRGADRDGGVPDGDCPGVCTVLLTSPSGGPEGDREVKFDLSNITPMDVIKKPRLRIPRWQVKRAVVVFTGPTLLVLARMSRRSNRAWLDEAQSHSLALAVGMMGTFLWCGWPRPEEDCGCPPGVHGGKVVGAYVGCKDCPWTEQVDDPEQAMARGRYHAEFDCPNRREKP